MTTTTITTIGGLFEMLRQKRMSSAELLEWLGRRGAVDGGGNPATRGGHYNVPTSRCTVEWRESSSGDSSGAAGLRLIRKLG